MEDDLAQIRPVKYPIGDVKNVVCSDGFHLADDVVHVFDGFLHEEGTRCAQQLVHSAFVAQRDLPNELLLGVLQLHGAEPLLA